MPKIIIKNLFDKEINTSTNKNIFAAIQENNIDWMHACGTKGRCTTCKFTVVNGNDNISSKNEVEEKFTQENKLSNNERLACQCNILDDITILVPEKSKMPHIKYSN